VGGTPDNRFFMDDQGQVGACVAIRRSKESPRCYTSTPEGSLSVLEKEAAKGIPNTPRVEG